MTITPPVIGLITARFRDPKKPKINQAQMAEFMGHGRPWASKLMNGDIQNLSDEDVEKLEEFLGIKLSTTWKEDGETMPEMAVQIGRRMKESEPMTRIIAALLEIKEHRPFGCVPGPRWIPTQDMTKIGQEIIKIAFANEDKPGKVARLVLELLA